jgi:hypothetical protein
MRIRTNPARRMRLITLWALLAIIVGTSSYFGYKFFTRDTSPIPADIRAKLSFSPLVIPKDNTDYIADTYNLATPDQGTQVLTYHLTKKDGTTIVVSEYIQPNQFTDIPEYKNKFLSDVIKQSDSAQTSNGTVYIGRVGQANSQVGVMIEKGLLVFMNPSHSLDTDTWRKLGNQLIVQNTN